jgi:hypothetical protein
MKKIIFLLVTMIALISCDSGSEGPYKATGRLVSQSAGSSIENAIPYAKMIGEGGIATTYEFEKTNAFGRFYIEFNCDSIDSRTGTYELYFINSTTGRYETVEDISSIKIKCGESIDLGDIKAQGY